MIKNLVGWLQNTLNGTKLEQNDQVVLSTTGWTITVVGTVQSISKTNIDKSGRSPKYMSFFTVKKDEVICENCDFKFGETIQFRGKEKQINEELGKEMKVGDKVNIRSIGIDKDPKILTLNQIKLI